MQSSSGNVKTPSKSGQSKSNKIPLSLKMVLECFESGSSTIDGVQFSEAVVVAKFKSIVLRNGKEVLTFQDGTKRAELVTFQSAGDLSINKYYKFFCVMTHVAQEFRLSCYGFTEIYDMAILNDHFAQIILRHLERTKGVLPSK